ncbi:MAG TPA: threonine synthase, partial [Candidatus Cloacimonadota bacterium]|nr:threonine synthase [Candidatus Cloacimonadota bacterium]
MTNFVGYHCSLCGKEYTPDQVTYTCPLDGGNLDVVLDYEHIRQHYEIGDITSRTDYSLWRYLPLLPVDDPGGEG